MGGSGRGSPLCFWTSVIILKKNVPGASSAGLARFLARAQRAAGLRGEVNVLVAGSREIRELNRRYRGQDNATDVLSFPSDGGAGKDFAGDIAISAELAAQSARQFGHAQAEELKILLLHGVLHLAGYDHERDNGRMARMEERLRARLGLPAALIARSGDDDARPEELRPGYVPQTKERGL
jgi:probable rRNA maturation factor